VSNKLAFCYPTITLNDLQNNLTTLNGKITALKSRISGVQEATGAAYKVEHLMESLIRQSAYFADRRGSLAAMKYRWEQARELASAIG
jgi:hypothetical protein